MPRTVLLLLAVAALVLPSAAEAATPTTTTLTPSSATSYYGDLALTFTAQVTGTNGTPNGSVAFAVNGVGDGAPFPLVQGRAVFESSYYVEAGDKVTAQYLGDGTNDSSMGEATFTVLPAKTRVAVTTTPSPAEFGQPVKIDVKVSNDSTAITPWGNVTLVVDGVAVAKPFPVDDRDGVVTIIGGAGLAPGAHAIEARFENTGLFEPAAGSAQHTVTAPPVPPPPAWNPPVQRVPLPTTAPPFSVLKHRAVAGTGAVSLLTQLPAAGTVTASASAKGVSKWGTVSKVVTAAGRATLVLNPSAKAKRVLAKGKRVALTVKLRFQPAAGGAAQTITRRVTVKTAKTARVASWTVARAWRDAR